MPTHQALPRFTTDLNRLTPAQRRAFRQAVAAFADDLHASRTFRPGLQIKAVRRVPGATS
ncbi:hypothetical protein QWJ26_39260 [Streptomyces sp. CSDS2]|uniref:hypothetical protein n=1 Tax=Streptomyces sp. CSDS2 TaxID=3055051 RepID=UPI0025B08D56|nr:hypothetical protein [Streptomyces sp. CSDS2]MDN3265739.1 hypothetical protein [Streptomyces sp. CSDS2]